MSEFQPSEERFGDADLPQGLSLKKLNAVLEHERGVKRWCFLFALVCVLAIIVLHMLAYDLESGRFHLTTQWGSIKGGIAAGLLVLAGWSVYRATRMQITIRG
jgi:hypothetical protein